MNATTKIGAKIKALRLASDLTQEELADRAELTKGFISQLENDQTSISVDSLEDILSALGVSMSEFFSQAAEPRAVFSPDDRIEVTDMGASMFEILVPSSTNNIMDPLLVELKPGEKLEKMKPGPGEQFGYVLKGTISLRLDQHRYEVPRGHCFYFESDRASQIANRGKSLAQLLWVVTPPRM
jgi:transcriptional regulator with XRE-family HTH domain